MPLPSQVFHWPAPIASDHRSIHASEATHSANSRPLREVVGLWKAPRVQRGDYTRDKGDPNAERLTIEGQAKAFPSFRQDPRTSTHGPASSPERRTLNPLFVEWLMGWPAEWTRFGCSATALFLWKLHMRSALWQLGSPAEAPPPQLALFG